MNASFVRFLIAALSIIWVSEQNYSALTVFPADYISNHWARWFLAYEVFGTPIVGHLSTLKAICVVFLLLFAVGYKTLITGLVSLVLVFHLGVVSRSLATADQFIFMFWLIAFVLLFREEHRIGCDGYLAARNRTVTRGTFARGTKYPMKLLRWMLLFVGLVYGVDAIAKLFTMPNFEWLHPATLRGYIQVNIERRFETPPLAHLVINYDWVAVLGAVWTIFFEAGLIVAILLGWALAPWFLGLLAMHIGIFLMMNILYVLYFPMLYLLFVVWDDLATRLGSSRTLTIRLPAEPAGDQVAFVEQLRFAGLVERIDVVHSADAGSEPGEADDGRREVLDLGRGDGVLPVAAWAVRSYPVNFLALVLMCPIVLVAMARDMALRLSASLRPSPAE